MKNNIKMILNQLDNGKIECKEAIKMIKKIDVKNDTVRKRASKLKISVIDKEQSVKIPAIPFGLINFLIDLSFGLSSIALKFVDDLDEDVKKILNSIDRKDIKLIFKELKKHGPFNLVDIREGNNTEVKITIL